MLPKADIHVHLLGTLAPDTVRRLAQRHGMTLPHDVFGADGGYARGDFIAFMRNFDVAASTVRTPEDYRDVTLDYLARIAAEGAVYAELQVSPSSGADVGLSYADQMQGVAAGIAAARRATGIEACIIVNCQRHRGASTAEALAKLAAGHSIPEVRGFGLAGDEARWPPAQFARAFAIAAEAGLGCTAHAGEFAGAELIREAIRTLPVTRLGHGVRAIEDADVMRELADRGIGLEVCPTSNIALELYASHAAHPLPALRAAGIAVALGSDDPPFFATSIGAEYEAARAHWNDDDAALTAFTRAALGMAFAPREATERLMARLS